MEKREMSSYDKAPISVLPDEILQKILRMSACHQYIGPVLRMLSGVCKRWQAVIFDPKGDLLDSLFLPWSDHKFNAAACGAWLQRQLRTGAVHWPLGIVSCSYPDHAGIQSEDFVAILSCAGTTLSSLSLHDSAAVFPSRSFTCLWAVPNLTVLILSNWQAPIKMDLFNRGVSCLRKLERFRISSDATQRGDEGLPLGVGFECFPEVLCTLPSLQSLQFFDQCLDQIPDGLSQLTKLSELIIMNCVVKMRQGFLPSVLATLPSMESFVFVLRGILQLHGDDPGATAMSKWKQMTTIKDLCMSPAHVAHVHTILAEVAHLTNLQSLKLCDTAGIPEDVDLSSLNKNLTMLAFDNNELEAFPPWMAAFSSLQRLRVSMCTLKNWALPALTELHSLSIQCSNLREYCACAPFIELDTPSNSRTACLSLYEFLFIQYWKDVQASESLCNLTALTYLDLTDCDITKISPCVSRLQKLCMLNLSGNRLLEVPHLAGLTALEVLNLRFNKMPKRKGVKRLRGVDGAVLVPKMPVTEASLRWMLQCRYIQKVYIDVTKEERAKLGGIRQDLQRVLRCRNILAMKTVGQYQ